MKIRNVLLVVFLTAAAILCQNTSAVAQVPQYAEGEALIMMRSGVAQSLYAAQTSALKAASVMKASEASVTAIEGIDVVQAFLPVPSLSGTASSSAFSKSAKSAAASAEMLTVAHVRTTTGETTEQLIARLKKNPNIVSVQPNRIHSVSPIRQESSLLCTIAKADIDQRWGQKKVNAPAVWAAGGKGSKDIVVAVMDTGVIYDHPDLKANMIVLSADFYKDMGLTAPPASFDNSCGVWFHTQQVTSRDHKILDPVAIGGSGSYATTGGTSADIDSTFEKMRVVGDVSGHGTHVAGIIGAAGDYNSQNVAAGVNSDVTLMALNIFSKYQKEDGTYDSGAYDSDIVRAIDFLVSAKKIKKLNVKAVNMSFGGWWLIDDAYASKINALSDADILVSIASGNEGQNIDSPDDDFKGYLPIPAAIKTETSITVGATTIYNATSDDKFKEISEDKIYYSNYSSSGKWVDIFAPGDYIYSSCRSTNIINERDASDPSGRRLLRGTSMAAPMVTGAAALLSSIYPDLEMGDIKAAMLEGANHSIAKTGSSAYGRLDIAGALSVLEPAPTIFTKVDALSSDKIIPLTASSKLSAEAEVFISEHTYKTRSGDYFVSPSDVRTFLPSGAENVHSLPVFAVSADMGGKTAAISFVVSGDKLGEGKLATLHIFKLRAESSIPERFEYKYVSSDKEYQDGCYTIHNSGGSVFEGTGFDYTQSYIVTLFIEDNGNYDSDSRQGYILDPAIICSVPQADPTPTSSGSGGCSAGFAAMALLAAIPIVIRRKK